MKDGDTRKLIRVVGAVCMKDGLVFMAQRPIHKERGGLWEFPGGKVDDGETDREALKREMQEELKVRCEVSDYIGVGTDERVELHCYRVEMLDTPELFEHDAVQWVPLDALRSIDVPPADVPIIEVSIVLFLSLSTSLLFYVHLFVKIVSGDGKRIYLLSCPVKIYAPPSFYLFAWHGRRSSTCDVESCESSEE
jgi:8-oxo-dGTP diphosphatase